MLVTDGYDGYEIDEIRAACEASLYNFAIWIEPDRVYGEIHKLVYNTVQHRNKTHVLVLIPRGHQKSHMMAIYCAWLITINPAITIIYITATSSLAVKQLSEIKSVLTSKRYRTLWPEMVNSEENKRAKWTEEQIVVDHPLRQNKIMKDPTVWAVGISTNITGAHCDHMIPDDVVTRDNAYTLSSRDKLESSYSQWASVLNPEGSQSVIGTRYHPDDLYNKMINMEFDDSDIEGTSANQKLYDVICKEVEVGGIFLWPRAITDEGRAYGFDRRVLAKKKAQYLDKTQFWAQYYNDPNAAESHRLSKNKFRYYDKRHLHNEDGRWYHKDKVLNTFAAIDLAFSLKRITDWTAIVVIGIDCDGYIYVLDIDRKKTNKNRIYFEMAEHMCAKWGFKKIRVEVTAAQVAVANYIEDEIRKSGLSLNVIAHNPTRHDGSKLERLANLLEPRYQNYDILHFRGGLCEALEEELILERPKHDDIKDTLLSAIEIAKKPHKAMSNIRKLFKPPKFDREFGGVRFRQGMSG